MTQKPEDAIEAGEEPVAAYGSIADSWDRCRRQSDFQERLYVDRWLELLPGESRLLDLGCGSGFPITRRLLDAGHRVTGVDASSEMLQLARRSCPEAELVHSLMESFTPDEAFDGLVAWDSIFHLPRLRHGELFRRMCSWLRPGAPVLISLGGSPGEFRAEMLGAEMFYSGFAPAESLRLLREAGFDIVFHEIDDPSSRGHLVVMCRKP